MSLVLFICSLCNSTILCQILARLCNILRTDSLAEVRQWLLHASSKGEIKISICKLWVLYCQALGMCQYLKKSKSTLFAKIYCNTLQCFSIRIFVVLYRGDDHASWSFNDLKFAVPHIELLWVTWKKHLCPGLISASSPKSTHTQGSPWAYLLAYCEHWTQSQFLPLVWMAVAQASKFQMLTVLPIPHQNHHLGHLLASFRPFLACSMKAHASPK